MYNLRQAYGAEKAELESSHASALAVASTGGDEQLKALQDQLVQLQTSLDAKEKGLEAVNVARDEDRVKVQAELERLKKNLEHALEVNVVGGKERNAVEDARAKLEVVSLSSIHSRSYEPSATF